MPVDVPVAMGRRLVLTGRWWLAHDAVGDDVLLSRLPPCNTVAPELTQFRGATAA